MLDTNNVGTIEKYQIISYVKLENRISDSIFDYYHCDNLATSSSTKCLLLTVSRKHCSTQREDHKLKHAGIEGLRCEDQNYADEAR